MGKLLDHKTHKNSPNLRISRIWRSSWRWSEPSTKLKGAILPPEPATIPIIGNFIWLYKLASGIEPLLNDLHAKYGPVISFPIPFSSRPAIFINDHSLTHQALVQNGAVFAHRPPPQRITNLINRVIATSGYGPTWRLLRRNLVSEVLNPSRLKSSISSRKWALDILTDRLDRSVSSNGLVDEVFEHFQFSITSLFMYMAFGLKVEDGEKLKEIMHVQRRFVFGMVKGFQILNLGPTWLNKILFRRGWNQFYEIRKQQKHLLLPFIQARIKDKREKTDKNIDDVMISYLDTLMELDDPDENRAFNEKELLDQCSELANAGTDTMSVTLLWTMANIVKYPHIQKKKLVQEITEVVGVENKEVKEDDLQSMHYLKAVVMEALRLHPPGHFLIPHSVTEDIVLDEKYMLPKNCTMNFLTGKLGRDPNVWDEPMMFKPERFLSDVDNVCDITGSKEIKMILFGAGRRISWVEFVHDSFGVFCG